MDNSTIIRQWERIAKVVSSNPNACLNEANVSISYIDTPETRRRAQSNDARAQNLRTDCSAEAISDLKELPAYINSISFMITYRSNVLPYKQTGTLYCDGTIDYVEETMPFSEPGEQWHYPRWGEKAELALDCFAEQRRNFIYVVDWLTDFRKQAINAGFTGEINVYGHRIAIQELPDSQWARKISNYCADGFSKNISTVTGTLVRDCAVRSDFQDYLEVTVKPDRSVFIEFSSKEKAGPKVVGIGHGGSSLALTSTLFPQGFVRKESDFLIKYYDVNDPRRTEFRPYVRRK